MERGTCPVCDLQVGLRTDDTIRMHHRRRSSGPPGFRQPAGSWVRCGAFAKGAITCPGSGRPSVEAIEVEVEARNRRRAQW